MLILSLQNLNYSISSYLPKQVEPLFSDTTKKVILIALAIIAIVSCIDLNLRIIKVIYSNGKNDSKAEVSQPNAATVSKPKYVLKRDSDGYYTLPHFEVPGISSQGTNRAKEFNIRAGDFVLDTANGILPSGWAIEK